MHIERVVGWMSDSATSTTLIFVHLWNSFTKYAFTSFQHIVSKYNMKHWSCGQKPAKSWKNCWENIHAFPTNHSFSVEIFSYRWNWYENIYSVSQKTHHPMVFWHFDQAVGNFFINFLHTYYTFLSRVNYKFLFNYLKLWRSYVKHEHPAIFFTFLHLQYLFTRILTSIFAYWANDVTVDVVSYSTCLLTS